MTTSFSPILAHLRDLQRLGIEAMGGWGARIATWLVAGNAGALVFAFNAAVSGAPCERSALASALWLFAAGGGLALIGAMLSFVGAQYVLGVLNGVIAALNQIEMNTIDLEKIEQRYGDQPEDSALQKSIDEQLEIAADFQPRLERVRILSVLLAVPFVASACLFGGGVMMPVLDGGVLLASCAGAR